MRDVMEKTETFEDTLYIVGDNGPFQKRFNYFYVVIPTLLLTMPYFNMVVDMMVPEHWCHVPGRNMTNLTIEEWKSLTVPMKVNTSGNVIYSSCTMYNITNIAKKNMDTIDAELQIIGCQYGWEYNQRWYKQTIPTQENWVCENQLRVTNTFTFLRVGELIGGVSSGIFTDKLGRRLTFFVAAFAGTLGRLATIVTTGNYILFLIAATISNISTTSIYNSPLIIAVEMTSPENRAFISAVQQIGWSSGIAVLPGIMWLSGGDWVIFTILSTLPGLLYTLAIARSYIESPRWLLNRGRINECVKELQKISKVNKTSLPADIHDRLGSLPKNTEKPMSFVSLFRHWRIARNTVCSSFCTGAFQAIYYIIILNIENLGGNPLLIFFLQGIMEIPGYVLSKFCVDYVGRRWTTVSGYMATSLACLPLIALINDPDYAWMGAAVSIFLKFTIAAAYYSVNLQCFEFHPTCLRQTGLSICSISSNVFGLLGPYIVHLGTTVDARLPYVMVAGFAFVAAVCGFMLPETLHHNLPDTIAEAEVFGKEQSYWSLPSHQQKFEPIKI